jgi:hypothetical protein
MPGQDDYSVPAKMRPRVDAIVELTDGFCREHLTEDYADLAHRLVAKLARKRPSPLEKGLAKSWAAGILYALGRVNLLFSPGGALYMEARELCRLMNVSTSTAGAKATEIIRLLKIKRLDPVWTVPDLRLEDSVNLILTGDGLIIEGPEIPREVLLALKRLGIEFD